MIKQAAQGLNSRQEADPAHDNEFLPLITAPMSTVVDAYNFKIFLQEDIHVCLPRTIPLKDAIQIVEAHDSTFASINITTAKQIASREIPLIPRICIDTANGNMPMLHGVIYDLKSYFSDKIMIMSGNVASLNAYRELSRVGCDYIRVGIGGGAACTTTVHTGVGCRNLEQLIFDCYSAKECSIIIADGISQFIRDEKLHHNGYAAINRLIAAGAGMVMLGSIFNAAEESSGTKIRREDGSIAALFRGMSTTIEQEIYNVGGTIKPSEGRTIYNPVLYTLSEWVNGKENSDEYPGFYNAIKSAMAYCGCKTLSEFIGYSTRY